MKKYSVGVIGATGMVGQRFVSLLERHPWFELTAVAASPRSAGKAYGQAVAGRWMMPTPVPEAARAMNVLSASGDIAEMAGRADFVFCAVDMGKAETAALEEAYARAECPVISNNSAHRATPDVPMVIPELNPGHLAVIGSQRKRLGTERGFIAVKANCSLQNYVPAIHPLMEFRPVRVLACTYQAISGAGKTFETWPGMRDNVIPFIPGEEEKSEREPLKIWGSVSGGAIVDARLPSVTSQCVRVPVSDGHMSAVFVSFEEKPSINEIKSRWNSFSGRPQELGLPSAPRQFLHYFEEPDRPQTAQDRMLENGMAISVGRLREDSQYDIMFICLSHNTLRGAAGGAVLLAELLCAENIINHLL
ncbi:MAG: aspartate-semialdehyde dehydrogenase [Oscillospiraceae bacterium]|jgi:aspartate-semialdehyde dehydrogenase|nr:aspartate-semialdehyde dehydrogenase [Oscillospiraceae bacterium]